MDKNLTGAKRYQVLVRSQVELELMRKSGRITALALKKTLAAVSEGVSLKDLDKIAEDEIISLGGQAAFKKVPGYFWATCLTINDEVVHGVPRDIKLKKGDLVSIDLGAIFQGWYTDAAWTVVVGGQPSSEQQKFLRAGEEALERSIAQAIEGHQIGDLAWAMQQAIEGSGYSVVKTLCGHGVGHSYHEEPKVPGFGKAGTGLKLRSGMTLAIEAIYTAGAGDVYHKDDGWTIASKDHSLAGLFEMTVIVGQDKPEVITNWRDQIS